VKMATCSVMVDAGIAWVYKKRREFRRDPDRVYIGGFFLRGHSAASRSSPIGKGSSVSRQRVNGRALHEWNVRDGPGATSCGAPT